MPRPTQSFSELPPEWQEWLKRVQNADTRWRRLDEERKQTLQALKKKTNLADYTLRGRPEYKLAAKAAETARIERAETLLSATEAGVTAYRIAKHLGYPTERAVRAAIESLKGERVIYPKAQEN